ncbi:hypothetical protein EDD22DRAFT_850546 [Suillus occidentalis]|nr:hypothetical protein EDD22DRAFT_850546 [Suillus occidentalis]
MNSGENSRQLPTTPSSPSPFRPRAKERNAAAVLLKKTKIYNKLLQCRSAPESMEVTGHVSASSIDISSFGCLHTWLSLVESIVYTSTNVIAHMWLYQAINERPLQNYLAKISLCLAIYINNRTFRAYAGGSSMLPMISGAFMNVIRSNHRADFAEGSFLRMNCQGISSGENRIQLLEQWNSAGQRMHALGVNGSVFLVGEVPMAHVYVMNAMVDPGWVLKMHMQMLLKLGERHTHQPIDTILHPRQDHLNSRIRIEFAREGQVEIELNINEMFILGKITSILELFCKQNELWKARN